MALKPIYAHGIFNVCRVGGVYQTIIFRYIDENSYYWSLIESGSEKIIEEEKILAENMQGFLDEEEVYINDRKVKPTVASVVIDSAGPRDASFTFLIRFKAPLRPGLNSYVNMYEEEEAEYDYTVTWFFPIGSRVVKAEVGVPYEVRGEGNILVFKVKKGARVGGREAIYFEIY